MPKLRAMAGVASMLQGPTLRRIIAAGLLVMMGLSLLRVVGGSGLRTGQRVDPVLVELDDGSRAELDGKTTVVTFWASWCGPCRREAPILNRLHARGVPIIGVGMDADPMPALRAKARSMGIAYPIAAERRDLARMFGVQAVPTTFVVASDRTVVYAHAGVASEQDLADAVQAATDR